MAELCRATYKDAGILIIPPLSLCQSNVQLELDTASPGRNLISLSVGACIGHNCDTIVLIAWTITPHLEV